MVPAGQRRDRVSIQARTETSDGHDGYTQSWSTLRSRWSARVMPLSGRDLERAKAVEPRVTHEVVFGWWRGWRDDLDGGRARLLFHPTSVSDDDITFEIVTPPIDVDGKRENVLVMCREAA